MQKIALMISSIMLLSGGFAGTASAADTLNQNIKKLEDQILQLDKNKSQQITEIKKNIDAQIKQLQQQLIEMDKNTKKQLKDLKANLDKEIQSSFKANQKQIKDLQQQLPKKQ